MSGFFSVCWHSALQYLPEVAMQVQSGCAHFSVLVAFMFPPNLNNEERMTEFKLYHREQKPTV
jgi:hypothetical protein